MPGFSVRLRGGSGEPWDVMAESVLAAAQASWGDDVSLEAPASVGDLREYTVSVPNTAGEGREVVGRALAHVDDIASSERAPGRGRPAIGPAVPVRMSVSLRAAVEAKGQELGVHDFSAAVRMACEAWVSD